MPPRQLCSHNRLSDTTETVKFVKDEIHRKKIFITHFNVIVYIKLISAK